MASKDFLMGEDGDVIIKDGSLLVGDSTEQEIIWLLQQEKGWLKSHPKLGVGLVRHTRGSIKRKEEIEKDLRVNLKADGKSYADFRKLINIKTK